MRPLLLALALCSGVAFAQESPDGGNSELPIVEPPKDDTASEVAE